MTQKHTPTPCVLAPDDKTLVFFPTLARPVECYSEERATFIVMAVNHHAELVRFVEAVNECRIVPDYLRLEAREMLDAILAKVQS